MIDNDRRGRWLAPDGDRAQRIEACFLSSLSPSLEFCERRLHG